ncbi:MAG: DUF3887 domain-containing protein [Planctomycetaceae bacterium]|jgi:hypothetical protein|nr:DUF3887 domain-containing protein [Planctomycetaceae bacterium]
MMFYHSRLLHRILSGGAVFMLLAALIFAGNAAEAEPPQPLPAEKAVMLGYVEDFLLHNFRDVTMRKSLEWGDVQTDDKGNRTIRYRCEALIWDKNRQILCWDFTFDKEGKYVAHSGVKGFPKQIEKPDVSTEKGVKQLVEKFFSQNYRDITARKTLKWGKPEKHENGNVSITYLYEATIWNKDKIIQEQRFTFNKDGEVVDSETIEKMPVSAKKPDVSAEKSVKQLVEKFVQFIVADGKYTEAETLMNGKMKEAGASDKIREALKKITEECGKYENSTAVADSVSVKENDAEYSVFTVICRFEKADVTFQTTADSESKIAGFYVTKIEKRK